MLFPTSDDSQCLTLLIFKHSYFLCCVKINYNSVASLLTYTVYLYIIAYKVLNNASSFFCFLSYAIFLSCYYILQKEGNKYDTPVKDIEQFFSETGAPVQQFSFSSAANINQTTAMGNTFIISANSFTKKDGSAVTGNIDIKLRECVSKSDLILSNLTTMSGSKFLSTGGIFYLAAYQNDVALSLSNGKTINFFSILLLATDRCCIVITAVHYLLKIIVAMFHGLLMPIHK